MGPQPFYVVFAGVNGAGKSTFYRTDLWRVAGMPKDMARVNPDEVLKEMGGDWHDASDTLRAGKESLRQIEDLLARGESFNQETTLSGRLATRNIARARELGYRIYLYYIGVADADIALKRIEGRVAAGGHDISPAAVRRRFSTSLAAFSNVLDYCDEAMVFDNTERFRCLAIWRRGTLVWWGSSSTGGNWLLDAMGDDSWRA